MKAAFWASPRPPDRWKSTALQRVSVIDCWCEIVKTSKLVRAATNTADNHEKGGLKCTPRKKVIWLHGRRPFLRKTHLSQIPVMDIIYPDPDGWSLWHVTCRSACKLDSPNYHIYDVSSFIRLRACISNSVPHAWRSQEKAITPDWSWILLHVSVQVGMFGDTNGIGGNSWIYSSHMYHNILKN